jgi:hypothetical protein
MMIFDIWLIFLQDKAIKRFLVRNIVEQAAVRDVQEACVHDGTTLVNYYFNFWSCNLIIGYLVTIFPYDAKFLRICSPQAVRKGSSLCLMCNPCTHCPCSLS